MKIFGFKIFTQAPQDKQTPKVDKTNDVAKASIQQSAQPQNKTLESRFVTWIKNEFRTFLLSFSSKKPVIVPKKDIIPFPMQLQDFDLNELAAEKMSDGVYKLIQIAGLKSDPDNPDLDAVFSSEGDKIFVRDLYKINKVNQTSLISRRAGKIALIKECGHPVLNYRDVKVGDIVIQKDSLNLMVEVIEIDSNSLTVYDGRKTYKSPLGFFYRFKDTKDPFLDSSLTTSKIDFTKNVFKAGDFAALRYDGASFEKNNEEQDAIPIQYRERRINQAEPLYKLVKVVETDPDYIVYNGITHFPVDPADLFGAILEPFKKEE